MVLKDMFALYSEEGDKFRSVGEEIGVIEGGVGEGSGNIGVFDGSEVPEPPEVKSRVWKRGIQEGEISQSRMKGKRGRSAH